MKCLLLEVKFEGGLGNQLFQYAAARYLCIQNDIPYLLLNTDSFVNQPLHRKFNLINFRIHGREIKSNNLKKVFRKRTKLNSIANFLTGYHLIEDKWQEENLAIQLRPLTSLSGFWQSPGYFKNIRAVLLKELIPVSLPVLPFWMSAPNTVAIHVRRTDYLFEPRYGFVGLSYYLEAIRYMQEKISGALFIFFSDDLGWCKQHFNLKECIFFEDINWQPDYLQLHLMSRCNHQIIANSSFSWWAAWLNINANKIVVRPATPFKDINLLYPHYYPAGWVAIENRHE